LETFFVLKVSVVSLHFNFFHKMNVYSLQLNHSESDFLIKVILKNNKVENLSLEFELEISKDNIIKKNGILINEFDISDENIIRFKSFSFQNINPNINFIKGHLTINNITKIIELEAYAKIFKGENDKSKVIFELIGEINKSAFNIGLNEKVRINGKAIGKLINIEGNFEFYSN
jgi:hypothetical protein